MLPREKCSGCTACVSVCPKRCIDMMPDKDGFLYPYVHQDECIHCGKCEHVCPVLNCQADTGTMPTAFAARNNNDVCRTDSSSGGIFSALAEAVIAQGGIVFGVAMSASNRVEHQAAEIPEELIRLRGSKYVSSYLGDTFLKVRRYLEAGRMVLFSGTPCQVEGLLAFLQRPYEKLLTVDLICHGVPSAKVWSEYVKYQEKRYGASIRSVSFRSKDTGWKDFSMKLGLENGLVYRSSQRDDAFLKVFLGNMCLRPSCHDCTFKNKHRKSDITLGDFWGIQEIMPDVDDDRGISLVLVHTQKGQLWLRLLEEKISLHEIDAESAIEHNAAMVRSVLPHHFRQYFFYMLGKQSFDKLVRNCFYPSYAVRLHRKIIQHQQRAKYNGTK